MLIKPAERTMPISLADQLPTELLCNILELSHAARNDSGERLSNVTVSKVCRHWKQIICDMPHLWTECVIGENIANWGPIFTIRLYLENAKDLTITTLGLDNNTISAVFHDLCRWRMPHRPSKILIVERLQSLSVTACSEMVDFAAEGLSFPALRSVSIQRIGHVFPTSILGACPNVELVELSFDGAYTLHDLVADGSHFPGSKLTLIWLGNPQLEAVVDYFSGLTQLHSL